MTRGRRQRLQTCFSDARSHYHERTSSPIVPDVTGRYQVYTNVGESYHAQLPPVQLVAVHLEVVRVVLYVDLRIKPEPKPGYFSECRSLRVACFKASVYRSVSSRVAAHLGQVMQWSSKARASPAGKLQNRYASAVSSGSAGQWSGFGTVLFQREIETNARPDDPSRVLALSPYSWGFAASRCRRNILIAVRYSTLKPVRLRTACLEPRHRRCVRHVLKRFHLPVRRVTCRYIGAS